MGDEELEAGYRQVILYVSAVAVLISDYLDGDSAMGFRRLLTLSACERLLIGGLLGFLLLMEVGVLYLWLT